MTEFKMLSSRPYFLRAAYEWILDNQCTPYLLVDARDERVQVPREFVKDGEIVLNINPSAVGKFFWDNDIIEFSARFGGVARQMRIPMWAVLAIYAKENGEGMVFGPSEPPQAEQQSNTHDTPLVHAVENETDQDPSSSSDSPDASGKKAKRPSLKVVK